MAYEAFRFGGCGCGDTYETRAAGGRWMICWSAGALKLAVVSSIAVGCAIVMVRCVREMEIKRFMISMCRSIEATQKQLFRLKVCAIGSFNTKKKNIINNAFI